MTPTFDFEPAATALETVVAGIANDQLAAPTPCADTTVAALLEHVLELTEAFRQSATKESVGNSTPPALEHDSKLPDDWRTRIPAQLKALVAAWREPDAWEGETEAGGVREAAIVMAVIALDEVVVHGWDLAKATGQPFSCTESHAAILFDFLRETPMSGTPGLFGPVVDVPAAAPLLDRVIGLTGRDPNWSAQSD
ncbi:TIGR03086 family metal-binding protein [Nocardia amikacinitolerans]|uniref:TIGR03086 family metal-binding protein n=1 Tax=Nocardia amikacinitolerans TaxID=756689 RepID=UPI0020A579FB|nr:TIGR03086 family metal-binding protein [Nocardia amikacinitolerans]MCP2290408.1 TIGR03086 family protein [Nocardia amikacinitolerans]